ncbi:PIN domain nuclease, a component of toxin-antitoxin system (PIN domain) [Deinococcus reticulitermitis]|uniref:PIN domain nuclease, a component of toxin-antitoxin system (PIN domain) n=1 Tax=Deinococcus reticulitermitis TaxID=856736 RepID=A0A1H6Z2N1_9DEIO|nr:type II toxin-antitoxin system VapC family toxin [Deinococcus reticulitermitis]SEJ45657.1 PIN domain nuclease, a component of toxin-antitoxin system (PIN domain) [Deinococcus reticulitermitis]
MSDPARPGYVLDASALIAYLNRERGGERVAPHLRGAFLSTVNLSEVMVRVVELGHQAQDVPEDVADLQVEIVSFSPEHARLAAELRPATRALGLSLGDRACLALGLERGATVLTADRAWGELGAPHNIEVIR